MMPRGFSTSPCLSRWTMVVSDIARSAYLLGSGQDLDIAAPPDPLPGRGDAGSSRAARRARPCVPGPGSKTASYCHGDWPSYLLQRVADFSRHVARVVPHGECGETQHAVPLQG